MSAQATKLIKRLNSINFNDKLYQNAFSNIVETMRDVWKIFNNDNTTWKDIIHYPIQSSLRNIKLGKTFNEAKNSIFDFIVGGINFGSITYEKSDYDIRESANGVMILNINNQIIYCYYKINMGGCPTCGLDWQNDTPDIELYMASNIEETVNYCMSSHERSIALDVL